MEPTPNVPIGSVIRESRAKQLGDTREVLITATPAQIREHVRGLLEIWAPGGGFVFQQVHNILADAPPENITAMLDAVAEFGR